MTNPIPPGWDNLNHEWLRVFREALRPFAEHQKAIQQALKPMQDALARVSREIERATAGFSESMRIALERLERYPEVCTKFGWPPFDVPLSVVAEVVDLYDRKGMEARTDIDALFVRLVSKRALQDLRQEWSECHLLRRRAHILDAALRAHTRREFTLTVPVLLASVEGVVADLHVPKGRMKQADVERFLAETFASEDGPRRWSSQLNDAARSVIADAMVGSFVHGDPAPQDVRRNAVLHGADTAYDTEPYSLKAILMLDLVREQYGYVSLADSDAYHRQTCSTLRRSTKRAQHFKSPTDAERVGKRACGVCHPDQHGPWAADSYRR